MHFEPTARTKIYMERLLRFMDEHIYPNEQAFADQVDAGPTRWQIPPPG